jgi:hypothetical protein
VLRPGGTLFMAVPDKRFTFDKDRPATTVEHLVRDYDEGPERSLQEHLEEWSRLVARVPEEDVGKHARELFESGRSIHFHAWTQAEFLELLLYCRNTLHFPYDVVEFRKNDPELVCVLQRSS